ncbi:jg25366 [Pararge aegeria aegeria]|uniref:Jg25366 protein n=1 Tax=Pararge aegeria aegeria TaxID=348720 RepID=A0A8S4S4R6_9NEOP|nr:jg25366 [Pararge aegeria aegeria]
MRAHGNRVRNASERGSRHEARAKCHGALAASPPCLGGHLERPVDTEDSTVGRRLVAHATHSNEYIKTIIVLVVRGKMSSKCLWHACRALSAGLLLMLLGAAMAVIGFIVVAACVMTFEARDSAAKVTPARPQTLPRPLPRRGPCAAPARLDQLGVYRLPHVLPLPHALPLAPPHRIRPPHVCLRIGGEKTRERARFGSAPDLRSGSARAPLPISALRRPLRRYALSVDEPPHSAVSASAAESECGSQSSLALDLHVSGACTGVTLRVRDNTRRRPLARQQRLVEDMMHPTPGQSVSNVNNVEETIPRNNEEELSKETVEMVRLTVEQEARARSAPPPSLCSVPPSPQLVISPPHSPSKLQATSIVIEPSETDIVIGPPPPKVTIQPMSKH